MRVCIYVYVVLYTVHAHILRKQKLLFRKQQIMQPYLKLKNFNVVKENSKMLRRMVVVFMTGVRVLQL